MKKKNIFGRNDVEARASVRTPSYAPEGGKNYHFLCGITLYQQSILYKMDIYHCILLLVFKYVRPTQYSVFGILFLM